MDAIELYLSPSGESGQTLAEGLEPSALAAVDADGAQQAPTTFRDSGANPNSLPDQGWAVVIPDNDHGKHLLEVVKPLIDKRSEDLEGDEVVVFRVPPAMSASDSVKWIDETLQGNQLEEEIPAYALVLGDLDGVSLETQQLLSTECFTGRIGFETDAEYESYVDKLLRWEARERTGQARALFFCAKDGTAATELGDRLLVQPTLADALAQKERGRFQVDDILSLVDDDPVSAGDLLLTQAAVEHPSILFSCSHGMGAPRRGWKSPERARALQGGLCLGDGEHFDASALTNVPFLPGGLWMYFACFGAGTPSVSAYRHWLSRLKKNGQFGGRIEPVLASLPADGDPPFIAALPKAVLASPDGPLGVIGHIDLAWSYSFQDLDKQTDQERHRRFQPLLGQMARGSRVGVALDALLRAREQIKTDITVSADIEARAQELGEAAPDDRIRLGHRWMLHQDLDGYVLLGDPAARLSIDPKRRPRRPAGATAAAATVRTVTASATVQPSATAAATTASATADRSDNPPASAEREPPSAVKQPENFGWFGKDKDDSDKEPGFFARFADRITSTLGNVLDDAATLEVKTYLGDKTTPLPGPGDSVESHPAARLHAYTRTRLDGDTEQYWALDDDSGGELDNQLRALHLDMVKNAQEHRAELLRILVSLIRPEPPQR